MAVRLLGMNCYVDFKYDDVDLRPKGEQEAYRAMEQDRILEQLSLGMISDEEACLMLTGKLPPAGAPVLSGTMFKNAGGGQASMGPNTPGDGAQATEPSNNGSTVNQKMQSDQPAVGRGQNRKADLRMVE